MNPYKEALAERLYTRKPIQIKAVQFTDENKNQVLSWAHTYQMNVYHSWDNGRPCLKIPTLEGEMICSLNDYIVVEPFPTDWRKLYPVKAEIFEQSYSPSIQVSEGEDKPVHMMTIFDVMSAETVAALSEALASEEPEKESDYIRGYRDGYAEAEYQRTNMH